MNNDPSPTSHYWKNWWRHNLSPSLCTLMPTKDDPSSGHFCFICARYRSSWRTCVSPATKILLSSDALHCFGFYIGLFCQKKNALFETAWIHENTTRITDFSYLSLLNPADQFWISSAMRRFFHRSNETYLSQLLWESSLTIKNAYRQKASFYRNCPFMARWSGSRS